MSVGQGFAFTSSHETRERKYIHKTGSQGTALSDSHWTSLGTTPPLPHFPGAKLQSHEIPEAGSPHLPPLLGGPCAPLWGKAPAPHSQRNHSITLLTPLDLFCLSLPTGKVSDKQAAHGPDAVLLTAPANCPAGQTAGTATRDGAFQGKQVPAGETA